MNVAIIGGGSIGLLFTYYFTKKVENTVLYVRREDQAELLNRSGLKLYREGTLREVKVKTKVLQEEEKIKADLVVIAVKQYDLAELAETVKTRISEQAQLLFVQNGMGHVSIMKTLPQDHIYVGVVDHGALKIAEHKVEHSGEGTVKLAAFRGDSDAAAPIFDQLAESRFPIEVQEDWYQLLAEKLLVNAVINPLTALYHVENGRLLTNDYFHQNMKNLFDEAFHVLCLEDKEKSWNNVKDVCNQTARNRSSMLRDIETGRQTEIDAISGYLLERADRKACSVPLTKFVYNGIIGLTVNPG
ncbi:MAG TPA: 2-dehydropantoate 2-reductase [Bacillales bacterium]|nr:2-dehydropantoate 2-reductase [Bacillales bacterium]